MLPNNGMKDINVKENERVMAHTTMPVAMFIREHGKMINNTAWEYYVGGDRKVNVPHKLAPASSILYKIGISIKSYMRASGAMVNWSKP